MADFNSFKEAVYLAIDIFHSRNQHQEISQNPLKIRPKQEFSKKGE
jgi:4-hydroxythreonine-4-phosphate dehydrogenase